MTPLPWAGFFHPRAWGAVGGMVGTAGAVGRWQEECPGQAGAGSGGAGYVLAPFSRGK